MLHAHRDIVNNTYSYTFKFSHKDNINHPCSTLVFVEVPTSYSVAPPTLWSDKLQFGDIQLLPTVYTENIMEVHQQYLREADTLANKINSITEYINTNIQR